MNVDIQTSETDMIEQGHTYLSGAALAQKITNKTVLGEFGYQFKFISTIKSDGAMEGKNNAGAHDFGTLIIDKTNSTISIRWHVGWESSTTRAYEVDGIIRFYDASTGAWRYSFSTLIDGIQQPLEMPANFPERAA